MRIVLCRAALCLGLLLPVVSRAASPGSTGQARLPVSEDFPAGAVFSGRNRLVLGKDDMFFRTRLRDVARRKPNFASHYVLAAWGCGAMCQTVAVVDVRSGRVTWPPGSICCWGYGDGPEDPVQFRLHSSLLLMTGLRNEQEGDDGTHYYRIEGPRFVHLKDVWKTPSP